MLLNITCLPSYSPGVIRSSMYVAAVYLPSVFQPRSCCHNALCQKYQDVLLHGLIMRDTALSHLKHVHVCSIGVSGDLNNQWGLCCLMCKNVCSISLNEETLRSVSPKQTIRNPQISLLNYVFFAIRSSLTSKVTLRFFYFKFQKTHCASKRVSEQCFDEAVCRSYTQTVHTS